MSMRARWSMRRWALGRGASVAALAGALVFAPMGVQAAQADATTDTLKVVTLAGGGVLAAAPGTLAAAATAEAGAVAGTAVACAATVICGGVMVAVGVGILAYTTKDYWVPWIHSEPVALPPSEYPFLINTMDCGSFGGPFDTFYCGSGTTHTTTQVGNYAVTASPPGWDMAYIALGGNCRASIGSSGGSWPYVMIPWSTVPTSYTICTGEWNNYANTGRSVGVANIPGKNGQPAVTVVPPAAPGPITTTTNKVCQRPDGSQYTDSRSISNATTSIPVGYCQPGDKAVSLGVTVTPVGGSPIATQTLPLTPTSPDVTAYPLCASAACTYQILVDGKPCRVGMAGCSDWWAISQATPARVQARYGPYAVAPGTVPWLRYAYDSPSGTQVSPVTGPNTGTGLGPKPSTDPAPAPITDAPTLTDPAPIPPPVGEPVPGQSEGDCWPGGSAAWNPAEWVLRPVKCALSWAFVPPAGTLTGPLNDFKATWGSRPPGSLVNGSAAVMASLSTGWDGGCSGHASADFGNTAGKPMQLPCQPAGGGAGSIPFTVMQIALIVGTVISVWHMVGAGISAHATGD